MTQTICITCEFRTVNRARTAICIRDGSEVVNELGRKISRNVWIPIGAIRDQDFDSVHDLTPGDKIEIFLDEWFATEKGLV
jgi:hypothetical protein